MTTEVRKYSRKNVLKQVSKDGLLITKYPEYYYDVSIVNEAIKQNIDVYFILPEKIKQNLIHVKFLMKISLFAAIWIPEEFFNSKNYVDVFKLMKKHVNCWYYLPEKIRNEKWVYFCFKRFNGSIKRYVNTLEVIDEEIVLRSSMMDGISL